MAAYQHLVKEFMADECVTCLATTPIATLMQCILDHDVSTLIVVNDDGSAVGLVSRIDVVLAQPGAQASADADHVASDIMKTALITCTPETPVLEAVTTMYRNRVDHLLVIKPDSANCAPIGVISMSDIVRRLTRTAPACWRN